MKKFRLLLLDANIVIEISRHGLWPQVIDRCEIRLSQTVIEESRFFEDANGDRQPIDLQPYIDSQALNVFDLPVSELSGLRAEFDPTYFEKPDLGDALTWPCDSVILYDRRHSLKLHEALGRLPGADEDGVVLCAFSEGTKSRVQGMERAPISCGSS